MRYAEIQNTSCKPFVRKKGRERESHQLVSLDGKLREKAQLIGFFIHRS